MAEKRITARKLKKADPTGEIGRERGKSLVKDLAHEMRSLQLNGTERAIAEYHADLFAKEQRADDFAAGRLDEEIPGIKTNEGYW